jgi:hypothetical protein
MLALTGIAVYDYTVECRQRRRLNADLFLLGIHQAFASLFLWPIAALPSDMQRSPPSFLHVSTRLPSADGPAL